MMVPSQAAAALVLLEFKRSYGLGFVAPNGRVVTSFHVVADEREITVHLSDGRRVPVKSISALDLKRDLAVLDMGLIDATPVRARDQGPASVGTSAWVFGMVPAESRARWVEVKVVEVQRVSDHLTVYRLDGELPPDVSGGPLIGTDGTVLGVVTLADSDDGLVHLAVPWAYVDAMLSRNQQWPLSVLSRKKTPSRSPERPVPALPLSVLEGSNVAGLEATTQAIAGVIRVGAPAYNGGDPEKCYRLYAQTALEVIASRGDCPGVQQLLRAGLERAGRQTDDDGRAWALRDAFDGLLSVIERYLKAHFALARATTASAKLMN